ncbi:MAG: FRG domain-containing protein [Terriglobia bacterium]
MAISESTAEDLREFLDCVAALRKEWRSPDDDTELWYRGQQKAYWSLTPRLYRSPRGDRWDDDEIREEFVRRAPSLTTERPQNAWDWYFLMQHFSAATRLLDWTNGALIALYFAVKDNPGLYDAAVWALDPWWLNRRVVHQDEVMPPGAPGTSRTDVTRYGRWLRDRFVKRARLPKWPVAIYPSNIAGRIGSQRSCFTIHGRQTDGLERLAKKPRARLARVVVPSFCVLQIGEELRECGIDEATVFPDLEGLGRTVNANWAPTRNQDDRPHDGVCTRLQPSRVDKGGVGVFAIKKIPKNANCFPGDNDEMLWMKKTEVPRRPKQVRKLYEDFAVFRKGRCGCPPNFDRLTPAWYVNESKTPNVFCDENYDFIALRQIQPGEELTADYSKYSDPPS